MRALLKHPSVAASSHGALARYNAHTSAGDVLWAGVPIVTLPGELMVTRGASSLLLAGGGALTVARTFEEYEDLVTYPVADARFGLICFQAMALLMRPSALARARAALRNCRTECNLFRTRDVWVPNWEVILLRVIFSDCLASFKSICCDSFYRRRSP